MVTYLRARIFGKLFYKLVVNASVIWTILLHILPTQLSFKYALTSAKQDYKMCYIPIPTKLLMCSKIINYNK